MKKISICFLSYFSSDFKYNSNQSERVCIFTNMQIKYKQMTLLNTNDIILNLNRMICIYQHSYVSAEKFTIK